MALGDFLRRVFGFRSMARDEMADVFGHSSDERGDKVELRCGRIEMISMWIACCGALLAAILAFGAGVVALVRGEWLTGLLLVFVAAPIGYGHHVALGMAICYAERK